MATLLFIQCLLDLPISREKLFIFQPGEEDLVAFPQIERREFFIGNPFQLTFGGVSYQLTFEFSGSKDENIPIILFEIWEHEQAM